MIFEMVDGRNYFYQWDLNRQLKVNDSSIKEVHFCNRTDSCSLVVPVVNGYVNVPNVILQSSYDFRAFGYDGEATLHEASFKVKPRTKPSDYVYTEVEIKNYETALEYIDEKLEDIVNNGVKVDLTDYYTKEEVDAAIENVEVDLTGYATEDYVDEAIANLDIPEADVDLTGYATEQYVDEAIANIEIPEVDLSSCAKYYNFSSLENPSEADYNKLSEILDAKELTNYYFTVADNKVLRISYLGGKSVLFVYGFWNGADDTTIYAYQVDAANQTSTLLTSYPLASSSGGGLTQEEVQQMINDAINAIGNAEGGAY